MATLTKIDRPSLPVPDAPPVTPASEYDRRLRAATSAMRRMSLDMLVVYADREHCGDMAYLCGTDPRFEEGLLFLGADGSRVIYLGNECQGYAPDPALGINLRLYQEFSPVGQVRDQPLQLATILSAVGITAGTNVGTAGGKTFDSNFVADPRTSHSIPAFIVDELRNAAGAENVVNAESIFLDPRTGLRSTATALEILQFEFAAVTTSLSITGAMARLVPGVRDLEIVDQFFTHGLPDSAHPMVNFGAKAARGLSSPIGARAHLGDAFQLAQGSRGGLTCRAGAIASGPDELPSDVRETFPDLVSNYFDVMCAWYSALSLDTTSGAVFAAADKTRDNELWKFALNPGHYLHIEEWSVSTFAADDPTPLHSGMALQGDIITKVQGPFCTVNIEDGVALADDHLLAELGELDAGFLERVEARRKFIRDEIGVALDPAVMPLSNTPLWHTPYALSRDLALTVG